MRRLGLWLGTCVILGILTGCNSNPKFNFNIERRYVTIHTEPEGADVYLVKQPCYSTSLLGTSPVEDQPVIVISEIKKVKNMPYQQTESLLKSVDNVVVRIQKDGYETYNGILKTSPDETLTHTIKLVPEKK